MTLNYNALPEMQKRIIVFGLIVALVMLVAAPLQLGIVAGVFFLDWALNRISERIAPRRRNLFKGVALIVLLMLALSSVTFPAAAQTNTPIPPTATIVPITINSNLLLTQVNTWTSSLDDIVFLGVAIAIAIAILTFIGNQILKAFKGTSGGG